MAIDNNLRQTLSHSAELADKLEHIKSASRSLKDGNTVLENQLNELLGQAKVIENSLISLAQQFKADDVSAKQQLWERKLLDLTLRNNLLNMKIGKNTIPIKLDEGFEGIADIEDALDMGREFILQNKALKDIYRAVRINLEESGANPLFLTLGTLKWIDNKEKKEHMAPILLVPIEIVDMRKGKYAIRKRDEDVMLNITLMEFLKQNHNIIVEGVQPLPKDAHGVDVSLVMQMVEQSIVDHPEWEVVEDKMLGIFSFNKFVMWNDLHSHSVEITSNPLVRSLIEGRLLLNDEIEATDMRQLDANSRPEEFSFLVDADSSQLEAVVDAQKGRSFVLYGPPGTGKSQTITNLIPNALYHNKRVLFVAEKKAALEVVEERLKKIGLAPFCLELHSNKMDKKHFLHKLEENLNVYTNCDEKRYKKTASDLYNQRMQLMEYVNALYNKQPSGLSLHDCIERYVSLDTDPIKLPTDFHKNIKNSDDIHSFCERILSLDAIPNILDGKNPSDYPLCGLIPKAVDGADNKGYVSKYMQPQKLEDLLVELPSIIEEIKRVVDRNKSMSFINKTTKQYIQENYKFKKFLKVADIDDRLYNDIDALYEAAKRWVDNIDLLPKWKQYVSIKQDLQDIGLGEAVQLYSQGRKTDEISDSFQVALYNQLAKAIIAKDPLLCDFNGYKIERIIDNYNELNSEFQRLSQEELIARLSARNPINQKDPKISAELTLLRKRIGNKGRGTTIRNMINQMPNLLPTLSPVMLMSPISVAQYLDPSDPKFDIVVFDEASQIPTCEAIGSIARGKATVVVGDPKQMPPTSFFSVVSTDEEEADIDDLESILDDCISLSMPSRYLEWHYRSKHESLITFSNKNYYDGKLITFPSIDDMNSKVTWEHVDGVYDFGGTRTNKAEAEAIANETIERLKNNPQRSVGIIAFSKQQSDLIEDVLNEKMAKCPEIDIQNRESKEPIFIKNLENAQGDERDVILFSVGYGPDKNGNVSMNFGPLNKVGGERRLNVAVTRARYEMKIFSTLRPEHINESRTKAEGVLGLKAFLLFAQNGNMGSSAKTVVKDNKIIQQISDRLKAEGYVVKTNVGSSAFKVDVAVANPTCLSEYKLGIICDGEYYSQLKTVRDREIVRPRVLRLLGWKIMHVWSVDWLNNPDNVIKEIINHLK